MSLVISITCAVLATLLQQWARRYLKVTQTRYSLHKRARIRTFFAEGVEKSFLPLAVEALPMLLHVSLVLFFAGVSVFLLNVNLTIFKLVLSWIGICTALYGCTMLISILRRDSPYYTPLTPLALSVIGVIGLVLWVPWACYGWLVFALIPCFGSRQVEIFVKSKDLVYNFLIRTFMAPEKVALKSPPELDTRALVWTFGRLDEDHELARFFSSLPGFHSSKVVKDPLAGLADEQKLEILTAMIGFLDRTFSSELLSDRVKLQRADICGKAIDLVDTPEAFTEVLRRLASEDEYCGPFLGPVQSTEIVQFVRHWGNRKGEDTIPVVQAIFSVVVARVKQPNDSWFILASDEMAVPEAVLRSHATHGDSLSLLILIHIIRQQYIYFWTPSWPLVEISRALKSASRFDVLATSPELQHEFCALWNQIARKAQNNNYLSNLRWILDSLRSVYIALHQGTDSSPPNFSAFPPDPPLVSIEPSESSYPMCRVPSHILAESAPTTFPRTVQHHDDPLAVASFTSPDAPSLSAPALPHIDKNFTAVPPLDNPHPTNKPTDSLTISLASPDPANAGVIQDIVASGIAAPYPTPGASTSARPRPRSYTSPPAAFSLQDKEVLLTPSGSPNLPSLASDPVLDDTLLIGPSLSSHSPITRSNQSLSFPESHRSIIGACEPSASLVLTSSGPNPGTPPEDDSSPTLGSRKEKDALNPPSVHHAIDANDIPIPTPDLPPPSPSLPPATDLDVSATLRSLKEPDAELTGDHPPGPSHYQSDMV
jgi:hypothetical protein